MVVGRLQPETFRVFTGTLSNVDPSPELARFDPRVNREINAGNSDVREHRITTRIDSTVLETWLGNVCASLGGKDGWIVDSEYRVAGGKCTEGNAESADRS